MATTATRTFKLVFFTPPTALAQCKAAEADDETTIVFGAGAGRYPGKGGYTECAFSTPGVGQFRPGADANPAIGTQGQVEEVGEVRVETICVGDDVVRASVTALKAAHPYETPAYEVYKLEDF